MDAINTDLTNPTSGIITPLDASGHQNMVYIPYLQSIQQTPHKPHTYQATFNGGTIQIALKKTAAIVFLGPTGDIPQAFLADANDHGVFITFQNTHTADPYQLIPAQKPDRLDLLSKQIDARRRSNVRIYIARSLVRARVDSMAWCFEANDDYKQPIRQARTLAQLRASDAIVTKAYWNNFYALAKLKKISRRSEHPINAALDALSHYLAGMLQRWIYAHGLSPWHGFLHEQTTYPALVDDLIQPLRSYTEQAVLTAYKQSAHAKSLVQRSLVVFRDLLSEPIFVAATQQHVYRRALIHGQVLSLRNFLLNESLRYSPPRETKKGLGRPQQVTYKLPGEIK